MENAYFVKQCPLCRCEQHHAFDERLSFGTPVRYVICDRCGFVFQPVDKLPEEMDNFYSVDYRLIYQGSEAPTTKDRLIQSARAAHLIGLLDKLHPASIHRAMDVGSSAGIFMLKLQEHYKCQVVGVEPGSAYRRQAQDLELVVYPSLEAMAAAETVRFDLISLVHVLEHLVDPLETLQKLRTEWLTPDGWLLLETPNLYAHDSLELAHLSAFSRHTLSEMVTQAGYKVVWCGSHGKPRSHLLRLYTTLLARHLPPGANLPPLRPERMVSFQRQAGLAYRRIIEHLLPSLAWLPTE